MLSSAPERRVFDDLLSFKPNRHTLGGTAYLIAGGGPDGPPGNWLVDTPLWSDEHRALIERAGGLAGIFLTHRGAIGEVDQFARHFDCPIHIHEQEAYLVTARDVRVVPVTGDGPLAEGLTALWTPGHSPGSTCLLWVAHGGVLFTGRHLLPDGRGHAAPVRVSKTFHWPRQLASVEKLTGYSYRHLCPGAAIGLLRGERTISV